MILSLKKDSSETIVNQLLRQIEGLIDSGSVKAGSRMPSTRELAEMVGVNRTTIIHVYEELWARGYVESTPGSYTYVRKRKPPLVRNALAENSENNNNLFHNCLDVNRDQIEKFMEGMKNAEKEIIDMAHLAPDARLLDKKQISNCMREIISGNNPDPFDYVHPRGFEPLRKEIIKHMRLHNICADDNNVLITNGSQQSIQLIFQAFSQPGDKIVLEAPGYSMLYPLIKFFKLEIIEVPVSKNGMDLKLLMKIAGKSKIRFLYAMPTYQNQSGISLPQSERE
jgi:GntR family transcriptional regulator, regulator for abcA and norABC